MKIQNLVQSPYTTTRFINNEAIVAHYEKGAVYRFNETASFLWNLYARPISIDILVRELVSEFDINNTQAKRDAESFVSELLRENLLVDASLVKPGNYPRLQISTSLWNQLDDIGVSEHIPINVEIEITDKCNLKCKHCYLAPKRRPILSNSEIKDIIDNLKSLGCFVLTFTGGEVFLRKDTLDLLKYARDAQFAVEVLTNGTLITEEIAQELAYLGISRVQVSIYSADPAVHDRITGVEGSLEKTIAGVKALTAHGIRVTVACVVMTLNWDTYTTVEDLALSMGAEPVFSYPISAKFDGDTSPHAFRLKFSQLYQFHLRHREKVCRTYEREEGDIPCHAGSAIAFINSYGDVYPSP